MTDGTEKCNPKIEENQREDRRAFRKFIVLLLVSMVVGGITGAFSTMAAKGHQIRQVTCNHSDYEF